MDTSKLSGIINDNLIKIKKEFEELAVQFSLGKSEASDKFQELKKDLGVKADEWKNIIKDNSSRSVENAKTILEHLQVQAALGKAEAKDAFEVQKKKLSQLIAQLETELKKGEEKKG